MMLRRELSTLSDSDLSAVKDTDRVVRTIVDQELARRDAAQWIMFDRLGGEA